MKNSSSSIRYSYTLPLLACTRALGEALIAFLLAITLLLLSAKPVAAQATTYTWTSPTSSGAWTTSGNWTVSTGTGTTYPGGGTGNAGTDTATLSNVTSGVRDVTLNANETISTLSFTQTTSGSGIINELDLVGGSTTTTLSVANTLSLGGSSAAAEELLDVDSGEGGTGSSSSAGNPIYAGNITLGTNGVLELEAYRNPNSTENTPTVTGNVTVGSGGNLNIDRTVSATFSGATVNGNLTLQSGGTIDFGTTNSSTYGSLGTGIRFQTTGTFTATGGSIVFSTALVTESIQMDFSGASATFNSGLTLTGANNFLNSSNFGVSSNAETIVYNGSSSSSLGASIFSLQSDVALPEIVIAPASTTANTVNVTIGSYTSGNTLSATGLVMEAPVNTSNHNGTTEVTLGSNVTLGSSGFGISGEASGASLIVDTNGFVLDNTAQGSFKTTNNSSATVSYTLNGGGSIKATYFNLSANTGANGTSVSGAGTTLNATGVTSTIAVADVNVLSNTTGGSIDPTSIFEYSGTQSGISAAENFVTSSRTIGRLQVGTGTTAATLGLLTSALTAGGDITVNTSGILDLDGLNLTESHGATAANGGLNGAGTVLNGTATTMAAASGTTATLTLDTTDGNGSFSGVLENNSSGTGTLALVVGGTGTQILSGSNTYSGATTINGGTLDFAKAASLYNSTGGSVSNANAANISVASGATLALGVGATTTYFNSTDIGTVLGHSSFASGAILGLDTTNASGGSFTYGSAITNTNSGSNTLGLTKLGTGTLVLSAANTYTGTTTINGGTLSLTDSSAKTLTATSGVIVNGGGTLLFGASDTISHSATLTTLASGTGTATISMQGLNGAKETMGALTLNAGTTIINFGSGTTVGNTLEFSSLSLSGSAVVDVFNYNANPSDATYTDNGSLGDAYDRLLFSSDVSSQDLADINFYSGSSTSSTFLGTGAQIGFSAGSPYTFEVAVPEPSTVFAGVCLLGLIGWRGRRRVRELVGRSIVTFSRSQTLSGNAIAEATPSPTSSPSEKGGRQSRADKRVPKRSLGTRNNRGRNGVMSLPKLTQADMSVFHMKRFLEAFSVSGVVPMSVPVIDRGGRDVQGHGKFRVLHVKRMAGT